MAAYDKPFDAPPWWLEIARPLVRKHGKFVELGKELQRLVGRGKPWSHSVLIRFSEEDDPERPSQELARAISLKFDIPGPIYIPRNRAEAELMQAAERTITNLMFPSTKAEQIRSGRLSQRDRDIDELEGEATRHREALGSQDEAARSTSRGKSRR